ncbi:MAG: hypothetical protein BroJett011_62080 [Chloroflexota bacterium]|nr:MAG: hypothetical protein BroJett011_62080 [Chloroflexota bacterium]
MTDPALTYTLNGEMTPAEALDLAITLLREKSEPDRLMAKMIELHPGADVDRHALVRYRRCLKAIDRLQQLKREHTSKETERC